MIRRVALPVAAAMSLLAFAACGVEVDSEPTHPSERGSETIPSETTDDAHHFTVEIDGRTVDCVALKSSTPPAVSCDWQGALFK